MMIGGLCSPARRNSRVCGVQALGRQLSAAVRRAMPIWHHARRHKTPQSDQQLSCEATIIFLRVPFALLRPGVIPFRQALSP